MACEASPTDSCAPTTRNCHLCPEKKRSRLSTPRHCLHHVERKGGPCARALRSLSQKSPRFPLQASWDRSQSKRYSDLLCQQPATALLGLPGSCLHLRRKQLLQRPAMSSTWVQMPT